MADQKALNENDDGYYFGLEPDEWGTPYSVGEAKLVVQRQLADKYHRNLFGELIKAYEKACKQLAAGREEGDGKHGG